MADEVTPEQIESEARGIGWVPKEEFHGDPNAWVDAKTFIDKGKTFIPYLQADRRKLQGQVTNLQTENTHLKSELTGIRETVETLKEYNSQTRVAQLETELKELRVQLATARKEGDADAEAELEEAVDEKRDALREAKAPAAQRSPGNGAGAGGTGDGAVDHTQAPEFQQFLRDNPWWQTDRVMRAASLEIGNELATTDPTFLTSTPTQRFAKIAAATKKRFGMEEQARGTSKVEGSRGSSQSSSSSSGGSGKGFNDLDSEAQNACNRLAARLVGPGKAYKTLSEWQTKYAQDYFNS